MTNPAVDVAVIVGATSGVGRSVALDLGRDGWRVALMARRSGVLDDVARSVRRIGGSAITRTVDVAEWSDLDDAWVSEALAGAGQVALVYAAGVFGPVGLAGCVPVKEWRATVATNLFGAFAAASAVLPAVRRRGRGRLVFVSSAQTLHEPDPVVTAYATSKQGLNFLAASLAVELSGTAAAATCVHPGDLKTEMWVQIAEAARRAGPVGKPLREWAAGVDATGGDSMDDAVRVVRRALEAPAEEVNGMFLMPAVRGAVRHPVVGDRLLWGGRS